METTEFLFTSENDEYQEHKGIAHFKGPDVLVIRVNGREFENLLPYELRINLKNPAESFYEYSESNGPAIIHDLIVFPPDENGIRDVQFGWYEDGIRWFVEGPLPSLLPEIQP